MIDKTYQPSDVEGRIYAAWEEADVPTFNSTLHDQLYGRP